MREILFRGKAMKGLCAGQFVYGYYVKNFWEHRASEGLFPINHEQGGYIEVIPETVGQYTGLTDKNGKEIFEGDIVTHFINWLGKRVNGVVKYDNKVASWVCDFAPEKESAFLADWVDGNGCEIIGNIHDNPELMN